MGRLCEPGLHYLPLSVVILVPVTFVCTYILAVLLHHVEPDFPYISDTGTTPPESCIFSQLLNIIALLIGLNMYVRYRQLEEQHDVRRLNRVSFVLGVISAFGISVVANFQETDIMVVHLIGAILAFGLGNVYCWMQSAMSYRLHPHLNTRGVAHARTLLSALTTLTFISTYTCDNLSKHYFHGDSMRHWGRHDGGYVLHVVSAASEWIMCLAQLMFFVTFIGEFKQYSVSAPEVHAKVNRKRSLHNSDSASDIEPDTLLNGAC